MKVVIFGSRYKDFSLDDKRLIQTRIWNRVKRLPRDAYVITGGAEGVDSWANSACEAQGLDGKRMPALWRVNGVYNPFAGFERNSAMLAEDPDLTIGYWDGRSNGTRDTAKKAVALGIYVEMHLDLGATVIEDWRP